MAARALLRRWRETPWRASTFQTVERCRPVRQVNRIGPQFAFARAGGQLRALECPLAASRVTELVVGIRRG